MNGDAHLAPPRLLRGFAAPRDSVAWARMALILMLVAACIAGAARLATWSATKQASFDGAMNLEVARSLAEGHGYKRMYDGRSGFSHEIQSRAPFILPAAAIFYAFGVGVWQSQLTNLLYLAGFALVIFALVRRVASLEWGLAAVAFCLWIPGIRDIAMNAYGEVPALAWWLGAVLVLTADRDRAPGAGRMFWAGLLAGMAVLTKTVLAIGLVALVPIFLAQFATRRDLRAWIAGLFAFAAGLVLPVAAYELAHLAAVGNVALWHAWLKDEAHTIHMQAGTAGGFGDTRGVASKIVVHSKVLSENTGVPRLLLPFWIGGPIVLALLALRFIKSVPMRAALWSLVVFVAIYFAWWLGFTPTAKAWYRRIFNGVLVLEMLLVVVSAILWTASARVRQIKLGAAALVASVAMAALQVPVIAASIDFNAEDHEDIDSLREDLAAVARVPADETIFAVGWYSAPALSVYSGRRFDDISNETPASLAASSPAYLALDKQAQRNGGGLTWIDLYAHRDIANTPTLHLVEIDATTPRNPFEGTTVDQGALQGYADFHRGEYPYISGFYGREADGWRWAMADAEALLRYRGEAEFNIDVYIPELDAYHWHRPVGITVSIDGCKLGTIRQDEAGRQRWWLPMSNCPLQAGKTVAVRVTADNLFDSRDDRQLAYVIHALGFADPLPAGRVEPAQR